MDEHWERKQETGESGNTPARVERQLRRRLAALWVAVVVLAVVVSGVTGYGYLALQKQGMKLEDLPGLEESIALVGERMGALEARVKDWAGQFERVDSRLDRLNRRVNYNRELARTEARKAAEQVRERLEAQMNEKGEALDARVTLLESSREAERARLGQLQGEIAEVRRATGHDLGTLHRELARNEGEMAELARSLEPVRVDFELREDRTQELARGVSLRITGTNVGKQQVKGWMWLMPDRKTLWVRNLGIQQPFRFYHKDGSGPHELVITRVNDNSVAGYLLLRREPASDLNAESSESETEASGAGEESGLR